MKQIIKHFLFLVLGSTVAYSCLTNKIQKSRIETIEFGSGGGFSGLYATYRIDFLNRSIQKDDMDPNDLSNKQMRLILRKCRQYNFFQVDFNRPYNFTYFIKIKTKDRTNEIIWGYPTFSPPEEVLELYDFLHELPLEL